jgi:hypothetical protein
LGHAERALIPCGPTLIASDTTVCDRRRIDGVRSTAGNWGASRGGVESARSARGELLARVGEKTRVSALLQRKRGEESQKVRGSGASAGWCCRNTTGRQS